ncbi:uncharacterized protein EV422DRAFT_124669 [Fimicolochytrium jonesii]|uniref:uncharacterized protein n=1 Tax=Fimicolochytrium jonesii TaxID=1396493 RepID=UPI0022FE2073|nr:uncharacterized protein EV422DRAFT_124669 [Fimicolochytrium jonesii]KAI8818909.1 hypothetical protein EV422DRAFT_124669 [Fimicolochytrium jonesii]
MRACLRRPTVLRAIATSLETHTIRRQIPPPVHHLTNRTCSLRHFMTSPRPHLQDSAPPRSWAQAQAQELREDPTPPPPPALSPAAAARIVRSDSPEAQTRPPTLPSSQVYGELFDATRTVLGQYRELLEAFVRDERGEEKYTKLSKYVVKSSVGKHVRHVLEHVRILFAELIKASDEAASKKTGKAQETPMMVNYDHRHPPHDLSTSPRGALTFLLTLTTYVDRLATSSAATDVDLEKPIRLGVTVNPDGGKDAELRSSLGREIWFIAHHAIHHAALIRAICTEHQIHVPSTFGIAPSTQRHNEVHKGQDDGGGDAEKRGEWDRERPAEHTHTSRL